jgi:hypothetical protein
MNLKYLGTAIINHTCIQEVRNYKQTEFRQCFTSECAVSPSAIENLKDKSIKKHNFVL